MAVFNHNNTEPSRLPGETMNQYRARRKSNRQLLRAYLWGRRAWTPRQWAQFQLTARPPGRHKAV